MSCAFLQSDGCKLSVMTDTSSLETEFNDDMLQILEKEVEADLRSTRFRQMVNEYGGLATAHSLLKPDRQLPPNTFGYLRKLDRLDLTLEFYVVMEKYRRLFSPEELEIAQWRLSDGE
jgi:hypothetical protein